MNAHLILFLRRIAGRLNHATYKHHLDTDPACTEYRAPYPGSRLDRVSRGHTCQPCADERRFGWMDRKVTNEWGDRPVAPPKIGPRGGAGDSGAAKR